MVSRILRISLVGTLPGGEEWSVNPVYAIGGDFGVTVTPIQAQTIATAIAAQALPTGFVQNWPAGVVWTGCRVEARALDGTLETQAEGIKTTPTPGAASTVHPFQTAWVTSLRTAYPGASGRGRLYWPAHGVSLVSGTFRPNTTTATTFLSAAKSFLTGTQAAIDTTLDGVSLAVWSRTLQTVNVVNQLQIGDVLDTQRRRRDTLVELVSTNAYP